ncbi:MAG: ribonuclease P protein component [Epsilonproteobacteria bacterium]|nr:ribonuclease P protein component [Campylobacterota bacterium]PIP09899.1 MAG: ribonuclease P protein component [Sulfurimonas sp. CG23_combo_of_CG06-09_8_20_14_all_36_33]PIS24115.1 MAG: ribonuclease P protein component [Sulfurimonas sp. CG08_land_8_20_14_0_20_36_33]PIU35599.1 MAG: ribonuclease P protein component [Sulfurimonas sp. CG07_land_8_20_14_0_80_36_56]PIV05520.1 MAG: ribonuclease P protein component [Sulfurimonas sp. CG03_land_8_20_14_0_80_36_25]PIV37162.1 MAG: ribonuclease P protein 
MKQHREFQYIYNKGKNQHSDNVVLFFLPQNGIHKVGFTATKKIGNAVTRNRAKRRLRALFCEYSNALKDGTYIFVAKQSLVESEHSKLTNDFVKVLTRAKSLKENL